MRVPADGDVLVADSPTTFFSAAISSRNALGSRTTPLPMRHNVLGMKDAGRDQMEDDLRPPDIDRVSRVVPALIAGDDGGRRA